MRWRAEQRTQTVLQAIGCLTKDVHRLEGSIMALADTISQLQAEDTELAADVAAAVSDLQAQSVQISDLQTQIATLEAGATISADQVNALQTVADDLAASHSTLAAALPAPTPPAT